jgi:hypothetical protein
MIRARPGSGGGFGRAVFFEPARARVDPEPERADAEEAAEEGLLTAGP